MAAPDSNESPADPAEAERDIRPVVEKPRRGVSGVVMGLSALIAAVVLFVILDSRRLALTAPATLPQSTLALESAAPPPLYVPPQPTPSPVASSTPLPTPEPPPQPAPPPPAPQIVYMPSPVAPPQTPAPPPRNLAAPALVVDTGGNANATASCSKWPLCEASQKGLFFDKPQRQIDTTVLPPRSYWLPFLSTISKSPSTRSEPLLLTVIFVAAIYFF